MGVEPIWIALGIAGTCLQVVVIYRMTLGFYRNYPGVFFYLLVLFLTATADFAGAMSAEAWGGWYRRIWGFNNIARHFAGIIAVVSLYFHATLTHPRRSAVRFRVVLLLLLTVAASLMWNWAGEFEIFYVQLVGRDMSFVTAVMNLVLWFALIRSRTREAVLFLVSGGLGLNMAGEAIAQSLYSLELEPREIASAISVGSHLLCLLIWLRALNVYARSKGLGATAPAR